jgi:hypothetical protein
VSALPPTPGRLCNPWRFPGIPSLRDAESKPVENLQHVSFDTCATPRNCRNPSEVLYGITHIALIAIS